VTYTFWRFSLRHFCFLNVLWCYSVLCLCVVSKPLPPFVSSCVAHVYICTTVGTVALSITLFLSCAIIIMIFAFECWKWHFFGWEEVECFQFEDCLISFSYTKFVSESRKQIWFLCLHHMQCPLQAVGSDHWCVSSHFWWPAVSLIIVSACLLFMEVRCPLCHCALMHHTPQTTSKHCESYWVFFFSAEDIDFGVWTVVGPYMIPELKNVYCPFYSIILWNMNSGGSSWIHSILRQSLKM